MIRESAWGLTIASDMVQGTLLGDIATRCSDHEAKFD